MRRDACDEAEWREILGDWYNEELYDLDRKAAVKKLARIFRHPSVNLKPLAMKVEHCPLKNAKAKDKKCRYVKQQIYQSLKFLYLLISQSSAKGRGQVSNSETTLPHCMSRIHQEAKGW